jgi:beta-glucanase (GH16 family)
MAWPVLHRRGHDDGPMGRNLRCLGLAILLLVGAVGVGAGAPGRGLHSAFWGKPASEAWPPELDVEEIGGDRPDTVIMTNHWRDDSGHRQKTQRWRGPDFSDSYHVFGAEWSPDETVWYVDGVERARTTAGAAEMSAGGPFYVLLNLQVGLGGAAQPSAATRFPAYQLVDYVRIWDRPFDFLTP